MTESADRPNGAAMIEAADLKKTYRLGGGEIRALDGVSIRIESDEMVAVTGPSGSGKTTLMHILGCLDRPDAGSYRLGGDDVAKLSQDRLADIRGRRIGFVFQTFNLLARLSAIENVELPLLYAGRRDARERAEEALTQVGLGERMKHEPTQLSGGQRQRVAIARALVTNPDLVLADEPTGNLDSRTGNEIMELFADINRKGKAVIIVTHEPDIAAWCRRQVRMRDGKILSDERGA